MEPQQMPGSKENQGNSDTRGTQHKSIQMIGKNRARWAGPPQPARLSQASPAQAACSDTTGEGQPRLPPAQLAFVETIPFAWNVLSLLNSLFFPRVFGEPYHNLLPLPESCSGSWDFRHPSLYVIHMQDYPLVPPSYGPQTPIFRAAFSHPLPQGALRIAW